MKNLINKPDKNRTNFLLNKSRNEIRLITAYLTGHGPFNYHLQKMGLTESATSRFCNFDDETAEHILCECEALAYERNQILGLGFSTISNYNEVNMDIFLKFVKNINFILGI